MYTRPSTIQTPQTLNGGNGEANTGALNDSNGLVMVQTQNGPVLALPTVNLSQNTGGSLMSQYAQKLKGFPKLDVTVTIAAAAATGLYSLCFGAGPKFSVLVAPSASITEAVAVISQLPDTSIANTSFTATEVNSGLRQLADSCIGAPMNIKGIKMTWNNTTMPTQGNTQAVYYSSVNPESGQFIASPIADTDLETVEDDQFQAGVRYYIPGTKWPLSGAQGVIVNINHTTGTQSDVVYQISYGSMCWTFDPRLASNYVKDWTNS